MISSVESKHIDLCRPTHLHGINEFFLNQISSFTFKFNCPNGYSLFAEDSSSTHDYYGATHFVYYHNVNRVIDFLNSEKVFNIDGILSTNYLNSYLFTTCKIYQNHNIFDSDIA